MKTFNQSFITDCLAAAKKRQPDFNNLLKVLDRKVPARNTLFEFFLNHDLHMSLSGRSTAPKDDLEYVQMEVDSFRAAGYDYCTCPASGFNFPRKASNHGQKSMSVNSDVMIWDEQSYGEYEWLNPEDFDYSLLTKAHLDDGMKFISQGPGGVLENVTFLIGYNNLCFLIADEPDLVEQVFNDVGSRLVKYYELASQLDCVGALISNDDWGFNTQTMLSLDDMRKYVFPWHKKIVQTIHAAGKPAILHSCGFFGDIIDDMVDMGFNGRHSYEDKIIPVEEAYDKYHNKFAILGGIDLDFVCRKTPQEIYDRACALLEQSGSTGGYALGSGNSIPEYTPVDNYLAMIAAAILN